MLWHFLHLLKYFLLVLSLKLHAGGCSNKNHKIAVNGIKVARRSTVNPITTVRMFTCILGDRDAMNVTLLLGFHIETSKKL